LNHDKEFSMGIKVAMIINKSQWQSLKHVGISYGQLYVAISKVPSRKGLKLLIINEDGEDDTVTSNVVYRKVLRNV